jgi:hypothetical protein
LGIAFNRNEEAKRGRRQAAFLFFFIVFLMLECLGCQNILGDFVLGLRSAGVWAQNVNVLHA